MSAKRGLPLFIQKLWAILSRQSKLQHIICWTKQGLSFVIINQKKFSSYLLPKHFRHSNFSSFVRQLNMYNFHKVKNSGEYLFQFAHQLFRREHKQILQGIKRKPNQHDLAMGKELLKKLNLKDNDNEIIQNIPLIKNPPSTFQEVKTEKDEINVSSGQLQLNELIAQNQKLKNSNVKLTQQKQQIKAHQISIIRKIELLFEGFQQFQVPLNSKNFKKTEFLTHLKSNQQPYATSFDYSKFTSKPDNFQNIYFSIPIVMPPHLMLPRGIYQL